MEIGNESGKLVIDLTNEYRRIEDDADVGVMKDVAVVVYLV